MEINEIKKAITLYGKDGANSLEYIGLTIQKGLLHTCKVYQKATPTVLEDIRARMPYSKILHTYMADFLSMPGVQICDISENHVDDTPTFRIVFSMPMYLSMDTLFSYISAFYEKLPHPIGKEQLLCDIRHFATSNRSPLMQIGLETDMEYHIRTIKYYLSIPQTAALEEDCIAYAQKCVFDFPHETIPFLMQCHYKPIFVGVNAEPFQSIYKLYFISTAFGFQTQHILPSSMKLISTYHWEKAISFDDIQALYDMGLYMEGIAVTLHDTDEWRVYLHPLPRHTV